MEDNYSDEHQKKGKSKYEFLKDRMRNKFSTIKTYFELKKELNNGGIPDNLKEGTKNLLSLLEEKCYKKVEEINNILKED
jgi:hypothetical protein